MAWLIRSDDEIERQRLQAWQQLRLTYAMRDAPVWFGNWIVDTFGVWFWKYAVFSTERQAVKRRIRAMKARGW